MGLLRRFQGTRRVGFLPEAPGSIRITDINLQFVTYEFDLITPYYTHEVQYRRINPNEQAEWTTFVYWDVGETGGVTAFFQGYTYRFRYRGSINGRVTAWSDEVEFSLGVAPLVTFSAESVSPGPKFTMQGASHGGRIHIFEGDHDTYPGGTPLADLDNNTTEHNLGLTKYNNTWTAFHVLFGIPSSPKKVSASFGEASISSITAIYDTSSDCGAGIHPSVIINWSGTFGDEVGFVARVSYRVDGGAWVQVVASGPATGNYTIDFLGKQHDPMAPEEMYEVMVEYVKDGVTEDSLIEPVPDPITLSNCTV